MKLAEVIAEIVSAHPHRSMSIRERLGEFTVDVCFMGEPVFTKHGSNLESVLVFVRDQTVAVLHPVPSSLSPDWDPDVHGAPPGDY